jgi:hypothetical protein
LYSCEVCPGRAYITHTTGSLCDNIGLSAQQAGVTSNFKSYRLPKFSGKSKNTKKHCRLSGFLLPFNQPFKSNFLLVPGDNRTGQAGAIRWRIMKRIEIMAKK